jgi:uncharacterized SAM-binding protein YcdF (DUF218 family)
MLRRLLRRRFVRVLLAILLVWMLVCTALAGAVYAYSRSDGAREVDVIIVLGAGLRRDGRPGPALWRRGEHAAALYAEGYAEHLICAGGFPLRQSRSEADACREVLVANGVPEDAIVLEERSRSTEENAVYSDEIMQENGWETALVVSDGYHLLRAQWIFAQQGMNVTTSPARDPSLINHVTSIGREVIALHWQVVKTVLNLPVTYVPWL